jgi:hypothetical protein
MPEGRVLFAHGLQHRDRADGNTMSTFSAAMSSASASVTKAFLPWLPSSVQTTTSRTPLPSPAQGLKVFRARPDDSDHPVSLLARAAAIG